MEDHRALDYVPVFQSRALSCALTTLAFVGAFANKELSRGIFSGSAIMTVAYSAMSFATGRFVG